MTDRPPRDPRRVRMAREGLRPCPMTGRPPRASSMSVIGHRSLVVRPQQPAPPLGGQPTPMLMPLALPRRYLVGFDPRDLPHHFTDVLVVGGGLAGLRVALGVAEPYRALVVTKDEVRESNSAYAQGGI